MVVIEERPNCVFLPVRSLPIHQALIEVLDEALRVSTPHILQRPHPATDLGIIAIKRIYLELSHPMSPLSKEEHCNPDTLRAHQIPPNIPSRHLGRTASRPLLH